MKHQIRGTLGETPLLTEKDRPALLSMIDRMQANLTAAIVQRVSEGAAPLFARGYRINELRIIGFGPEITVEPKTKRWAIRLWWRRRLLQFQLCTLPQFHEYGNIEADDYDTRRLITQLKIFETYEGDHPLLPTREQVIYERRI